VLVGLGSLVGDGSSITTESSVAGGSSSELAPPPSGPSVEFDSSVGGT
jgi:hypothetical protein